MLTRSSAHVHTPYCDGKTSAAAMAKAAFDLGFVSLGFSSHAHQPFDPNYCMKKDQINTYRQEILDLKAEYAGRMAIYLGIEQDFYALYPPDDYDYFIASCHYFSIPEGFGCVDGAPDNLRYYIDHYCGGNGMELVRQYFDLLQRHVQASRPHIIGHFDLVRKNNASMHYFDEESPKYRRMALECLASLRETDAILEVNTGIIARGYLKDPYPASFLLKAWREMGGRIMLNSDCHDARFLACHYDEAEELMRSCGYTSAVRLGKNTLFEEYSL